MAAVPLAAAVNQPVGDKTGAVPVAGDTAKFAFFQKFLLGPER